MKGKNKTGIEEQFCVSMDRHLGNVPEFNLIQAFEKIPLEYLCEGHSVRDCWYPTLQVSMCVLIPPSGLSGAPFCLIRGAAGLPLTSRRFSLHGGGPLDAGLSPLSSGLTLSRRLGLSVPLPAPPPRCSIPLKAPGGAPSTVYEAGRNQNSA